VYVGVGFADRAAIVVAASFLWICGFYIPKGRMNIGRPRKRWRDQLHLEDQGTGNRPNPSGT